MPMQRDFEAKKRRIAPQFEIYCIRITVENPSSAPFFLKGFRLQWSRMSEGSDSARDAGSLGGNLPASNTPPQTNHVINDVEYFKQIREQLFFFLQLCGGEYGREFERIENVQRRTTQWFTLLTVIAAALYWTSAMEPFYKDQCSVRDVLYALSLIIAWGAFIVGVFFMFLIVFTRRFKTISSIEVQRADLMQWLSARRDPLNIEFLTFKELTQEYAVSQKDAHKKNEMRLIFLTCLQVSVLISLAFLLLSVCLIRTPKTDVAKPVSDPVSTVSAVLLETEASLKTDVEHLSN